MCGQVDTGNTRGIILWSIWLFNHDVIHLKLEQNNMNVNSNLNIKLKNNNKEGKFKKRKKKRTQGAPPRNWFALEKSKMAYEIPSPEKFWWSSLHSYTKSHTEGWRVNIKMRHDVWLCLFQAWLRIACAPSEIQELVTINIFLIPQNPIEGTIMAFYYLSSFIGPGIKFLTCFSEYCLILLVRVTPGRTNRIWALGPAGTGDKSTLYLQNWDKLGSNAES